MNKQIFKCFIASPSDTEKEREICDKVFREINGTIGNIFNFRIESLKWENNVRPSLGDEGQAIINEQIGNEYNVFIGIMYKKFGTPTSKAGSGTEEEFNNAYERHQAKENLEIMFYFNDKAPTILSEINPAELLKVNKFKSKLGQLGIYAKYIGVEDFEEKLRKHLSKYFIDQFKNNVSSDKTITDELINKEALRKIFQKRLSDSLMGFSSQPIIWLNPILSDTKAIYLNPDDNFNHKVEINELILKPKSTIIQAPPQFGLTCLSHYLVKEAWEVNGLWIYLNSDNCKPHNIDNTVLNEVSALSQKIEDVECIILDSWENYGSKNSKKLKKLCESFPDIPIIVMQRIDDIKFLDSNDNEDVRIDRKFNILHLLALPRTEIRKVVSEYNKTKEIGDDNVLLAKVVSDLELLNIHRTPYNCLTLLKVSEKYFDESPVNRTKMIEMVLFVLFDMDGLPTYKAKPDLKDCEYVLGRFCENMIKNNRYEFTRESFLLDLNKFCDDKLIELDVSVVFDVLNVNNIITGRSDKFIFKSSFWIYYFGAKRMHVDKDFADYIFNSKKYTAFPEIIEFYTGIDRNRDDALEILLSDIKETSNKVSQKIGIDKTINPFIHAQWKPSEDNIEKMQDEISDNVLNSLLPDEVKDRHADRNYDQIRPYNQSINKIFEEYSLHSLMQKISASSRALRNSDYVNPELKQEMLQAIMTSWEQISKVLFALAPIMASKGKASFDGAGFELDNGNWGDTVEEKLNRIIQANPTNVVGFFKDDLFSSKIGPLLYKEFNEETSAIKKHHLALMIIFERPKDWKKQIEEYIVSLPKNSFFLYDSVNALRGKYRFGFLEDGQLKEIEYLIKMGLAKHHFGVKKPLLDKITKISNDALPKREAQDE